MTAATLPNGVHSQAPVTNGTDTPTSRAINILKFGGTSVGKFPLDIVNVVKTSALENEVAIVCSARSSSTKAAGTTNRLLRAATEAENHREFQQEIEAVRVDHIETADSYIQSQKICSRLKAEIENECSLVVRILEAAQTLGETSPRSRDKVMSAGEKLSCRFMAALLEDRGIEAEYVDLADIIDFKVGHSLDQEFYDHVADRLGKRLQNLAGKVPVITGYFGSIPRGLLMTVGRGYTDLCAALVAVGLQAKELQIWKEVDGIFTADPRKVPTAKLIPQISPAEAAELTFYGSEVIHPSTMDQVIRARIPIRIKNVMNPRGGGTIVYPDTPSELTALSGHYPKLFRSRSASYLTERQRPKRPTAVTMKHRILVMNIHSNKRALSHGFFAGIFATLDKWRLSVDVISTSEVNMSMALHSEAPLYTGGGDDEYKIVDQDLRGAIDELKSFGTVDIIPDMAIVSLVGKQMKNMVGIAGRMFSTLGENNVNIEMISQVGASEINISCVIDERDADRALNILHTNLFTFLET
ncbi:aspartate kinase [Capronia epimyces CBS 606.96]|uniref:Aspartokinase n=1 Tax=Capronia epimyces CBS 606.96 TaxID=1182542 RepID=W9Y102_9EURO|nr:aspartate kinase [Capronia epimyces CBS 606.96]EXJ86477.1 aspartate kinase [Capronia epimyces CBS 606.96]